MKWTVGLPDVVHLDVGGTNGLATTPFWLNRRAFYPPTEENQSLILFCVLSPGTVDVQVAVRPATVTWVVSSALHVCTTVASASWSCSSRLICAVAQPGSMSSTSTASTTIFDTREHCFPIFLLERVPLSVSIDLQTLLAITLRQNTLGLDTDVKVLESSIQKDF